MNAVKDKLFDLVGEELAAANAIYPPFASMHEGYAVLLEEVEEAKDELETLERRLGRLWAFCKRNRADLAKDTIFGIEGDAIHLAAEAIQVAAMARKFQAIGKDMNVLGKEEERKAAEWERPI